MMYIRCNTDLVAAKRRVIHCPSACWGGGRRRLHKSHNNNNNNNNDTCARVHQVNRSQNTQSVDT